MQRIHKLAAVIASIVIASAFTTYVLASHTFEAGVAGTNIPVQSHIRLDGLVLAKQGVMPLYDASPNFISAHLLLQLPCDNQYRPLVTVIAGHIDESARSTFVDKVPLYFIRHASTAGGERGLCVYHAHIPDPLNGGAPRVTDIALVNFGENAVRFPSGSMAAVTVHRILGSIATLPYTADEGAPRLPSDLAANPWNPVFDLNDDRHDNDGLGHR